MAHYLDYAATSAVRPRAVVEAVTAFLSDSGGTPGRGGHAVSVEAARIAFRCRRSLTRILDLPADPGRIAFMLNATHALNTALWGILRERDVLVVSQYDHNAVLRPAHQLARHRSVEVRTLGGQPDGSVDLAEAEALLDGARLLVVNAASNVLGTLMPVNELIPLAHSAGALVLVDTAQSAGHMPLGPWAELPDLVAFTGHKGLLGPQGTGGLWVREGLEVEPFLTGGTGGNSLLRDMPPAMPDHLEAGTVNAPGIAGLLAGCNYVLGEGMDQIHERIADLKERLRDGLDSIAGLRVLSPPAPDGVGLVTAVSDRIDPATLSQRLDAEWGVMTRAGLHCAPEVHRILGTTETGAVRYSLGWASSVQDVDRALEGTDAVVGAATVAAG